MNEESGRQARLTKRANELRLLHRVSCEINASLDVQRILDVAMRSLDELFGLAHASAFLVDPDRGDLVRAAQRGDGARERRERVGIGTGMVGAAAGKREIVRINRPRGPIAAGDREAIESHIAIPMLAEEHLVGVLSARAVADHVVRKDDEILIEIVANQAAVAVQTARLYANLQALNEQLEERVRVRTLELERANRELRDAQAQLVQSGKMAALGQLAAGLAHEMNTPLGAIHGSTDVASRALRRITDHLAATGAGADRAIERALEALENTQRVTGEACDRVVSIVAALRSFAKLDEAAVQPVDLRRGLDDALGLVSHLLGDRIEVIRDYADVPLVKCYASEVNQVLLIVLTNAAESIRGAGTLKLRTRQLRDHATIEVEDDGRGIASEHLARIFDPGFTTKGVGVGTGLGLAIAFRIMEKHGGSIEVDSEPERGTRVRLHFPLGPRS